MAATKRHSLWVAMSFGAPVFLGECDGGLHLVASAKEIERLGLHRRQRRQDPRFADIAEDGDSCGKLAFGGLEIPGKELDPSTGQRDYLHASQPFHALAGSRGLP